MCECTPTPREAKRKAIKEKIEKLSTGKKANMTDEFADLLKELVALDEEAEKATPPSFVPVPYYQPVPVYIHPYPGWYPSWHYGNMQVTYMVPATTINTTNLTITSSAASSASL